MPCESCAHREYPCPCRTTYSPLSSRMGSGVGLHTSRDSSSRMYSVSLGGSRTGSLDHAVSRFSWLFTDQLQPAPASDTRHPNSALAMTLIHGAGVQRPSRRRMTYSRVAASKPPRPLKNSSALCGAAGAAAAVAAATVRTGAFDATETGGLELIASGR